MECATNTIKNDQKNKQEIYRCELCDYICYHRSNYNRHILTKKHLNEMTYVKDTNVKNEDVYSYVCNICKFECNKKSNYSIHLQSKKHIQNIKENEKNTIINNKKIELEKNNNNMNIESFKNEVITTLMNQLSSVLEENNKNILAEQTKFLMDVANKTNTTNNTNNTNIHNNNNKQFNMNVFLNETCKDAMNLSDFLENMHVSMEDMEKTGELGFAKGMSRIIMNNLNAIDVCKRPIHCSDVKRETLYVKNNGVWEKEDEERKRTKEIIYKVSCLNERQLIKWRDLPRNKGYDKSDHTKNDEFMNLVMEINKLRDEEIDKVITAISKHVAIDKDRVKMSGYLN
jgi:hypothetical protein